MKIIKILNDLWKINSDRAEDFTRTGEKVEEVELKTVFLKMADESRKNAAELVRSGAEDTSSPESNMRRAWLDFKFAFTGHDAGSVLSTYENGEETAQQAYRDAIASTVLSSELRQMVRNQQSGLSASHGKVNDYKESHDKT